MLQMNNIRSQWTDKLEAFLVEVAANPKDNTVQLHVIAQRDMGDEIKSWRGIIQESWVTIFPTSRDTKSLSTTSKQKRGIRLPELQREVVYMGFFQDAGRTGPASHNAGKGHHRACGKLPETHTKKPLTDQFRTVGLTGAVILILVSILAFKSSDRVTRQLSYLSEGVSRLAKGELEGKIKVIRTGDERERVATAFNEMIPQLRERMKIINDLEVAQKVQESLLPEEDPQLPWLNIAGACVFCDQTGGDYYDYFVDDEIPHKATIAIGDVTGHGVAAAILIGQPPDRLCAPRC